MKANKCTSSKLLILAAIVAMVFTSCSNEDVIDTTEATGEELLLGFTTYVGRASVMDQDALRATGFQVLAWNTGGINWENWTGNKENSNFMTDQDVSWNTGNGAWEYSPIKYWPGKYDATNYGKVSFFGYAPATIGVTEAKGTNGANPTITFTTPATAAGQVDLVADMLPDLAYGNGDVKFQFEHLLSKIGFAAKLADEYANTEVTVTGLKIKYITDKIKNNGVYTFTETNTAATIWGAPGTQTYMSDDDEILTSGSLVLNNSTSLALNANNQFLMLIPQTPATGDITAELSYDITTSDGTDGRSETVKYTIFIKLPSIAWQPGKQYTYTFSLTLNPVIFDTNIGVADWDDETLVRI
jgi:hypothetical protein